MPRNPVVVALPAFDGVTRQLVLTAVVVFFALWILAAISPQTALLLADKGILQPNQALTYALWKFVTYPFITTGLLSLLLAALSLWFFAAELEGERGGLWLTEYFFVSTIGGGILASVLSRTLLAHAPGLDASQSTSGLWPAVLALVLAYARFHANEEITFNFLFRLKAKYMAAIYVLIYLALALTSGGRFDALVALCAGLCGFTYLSLAPRRGLRFATSERWFGLRNSYYRSKRKRAAKKFAVYMRKQGKDANLDADGKYVSLEDERRDPNDRRWMN